MSLISLPALTERDPVAPYLGVGAGRQCGTHAAVKPLVEGAVPVAWFELGGGTDPDTPASPLSEVDAQVVERVVRLAVEVGVPVVGLLRCGADPRDGVAVLHGWGRVASSLCAASGQVPIVLIVEGACSGGSALLLGIADVVVMCAAATAFVSEPAAVKRITGVDLGAEALGGVAVHSASSGVAHLEASDVDEALALTADLLDLLPANHLAVLPLLAAADPVGRKTWRAAGAIPTDSRRSYDVREVLADVFDTDSLLELRRRFAPSLVTAFARLGGMPVGVVANQPCQLAGALDIESSQKGAAFVRWCDSMSLPLLTFVDTPGFRPGKDQEWRGMIRHGAQLAFAYAEASVPRVCVILRKAYGGAFIVMDCKTMGNDLTLAWPTAAVAVMGAAGAIEVLHGKRLSALGDEQRAAEHARLVADYEAAYLSPTVAAERGYVDAVIDPSDTRIVLAQAMLALRDKRGHYPTRRHENSPL